ncbi:protein FAM171B-like isoform X2 [Betta splendens]|uniref:Protein FAM171B-like isoform X2 n=1 Tax=Betta splendens TaxID=158456 RepID=A0A6P7LFR4_BETSP|nr:protein FAM171B-like isoform X2 [Betta splendens]
MRLLLPLVSALALLKQVKGGGADDGTLDQRGHAGRGNRIQNQSEQAVPDPAAGSAFNLHVTVSEAQSRRVLSEAAVDVYVNYTRTSTAVTGDRGRVLLHAPYGAGLPVVVVASKQGYVCSPLSLNSRKRLIFSSVTISLLGLSKGSIWFFEDSVLITGRTSDASSQPVVQFPKRLLSLADVANVTSVEAFLSVPTLPAGGGKFPHMLGVVSRASGNVSVDLRPVAAVSVQLFSGPTELHVSGPIRISLRVRDDCGLRPADTVPAWFFDQNIGAWMRKGLGAVAWVDGQLLWTFTAPHLGYWIAAPLPSTTGFLSHPTDDFVVQNSLFLMLLIGGMLLVIFCLLVGLGHCHRSVRVRTAQKIPPETRKDQTTCTCEEEACELSGQQNGPTQGLTERSQHTASLAGSVLANAGAVAVRLDCSDQELTGLSDVSSEHMGGDNLFFFNRPVAVIRAPTFFHLEEQPDQSSNDADTESRNKDGCTQTLFTGSSLPQSKAAEQDPQLGVLERCQAASSTKESRSHFSLPESMSVPGTLNKIRESRRSVNALADLSKAPSAQAPRAWFVSLEGKPAAEIHYAVSEQQRRHRPVESPETSLDSGVDMSELNQPSGRRLVTLERKATFVKSSAPPQ